MDSSKQTMNEETENKDVELDEETVEEETCLEESVDLQNDEEGEVNEPSKSLDEREAKISELKDQLLVIPRRGNKTNWVATICI